MFLLYENAKFICATLLRFRTFSHVHLKPSSARYCIADKTYKLHITVQDAAAKPEFDKYVVTVNGKEAALKKVGTAYTLASLTQFDTLEIEAFVKNIDDLTVTQFKTEREQERLAQLQEVSALAQVEADKKNKEAASAEKKAAQARAKLDDVAPLLKGMEKLAADFSDDPERTLPEAGPLESAKSYREKKAKPLWEKIVKVLRSVYRAYFDLKSKFERLQSAYDREVSKNGSLSARIYEVCAERDGLKGQVRDYERVRRAIGPEQADRILEAAYQQEQVEKEQKWGARSKIRVGAR